MKKLWFVVVALLWCVSSGAQSGDIPIHQKLDLEKLPKGTISKIWLQMTSNGLSQPICVPIIVAKGTEEGPVLGLTAAIHGNELNGIPVIQEVFKTIDPAKLKGTLVGVPGLNAVSILNDERRFVDEEDLNRNFPGKANGNRSQQYVHRIFDKIIRHFNVHIDLHTASFGRINSLYVRADLKDDTLAQMAYLQDADIILQSTGKPSTDDLIAATRTMRAEAMLHGIPSVTVEYGDPQVYQPEVIERGQRGILNTMSWLGMIDRPIEAPAQKAVICKKSYWLYVDEGGLLEVPVELKEQIQKGQTIGILKNPFGDILKEYKAPEAGIIIGKSTNPVNMNGGRIIHLGILE